MIWTLKTVVLILSLWILYRELFVKNKLEELLQWWQTEEDNTQWTWFILTCGLVLVNWGIETRKWQYLVRSHEKVPFVRAYLAVLAGVFISFFTPNRVGEFAGRVLYIKGRQKIPAAITTIVGSMSQLLCTVVAGIIALAFFYVLYISTNTLIQAGSVIVAFVLSFFCLMLFFEIRSIKPLLLKFKWLKSRPNLLKPFEVLTIVDLRWAVYFSALRYGVFLLQYFFMLKAFGFAISFFQSCLATAMLFFVQSIIPTFAISELTTRGANAISILSFFDNSSTAIILSTYSIWLVNILVPSVLGGLVILFKSTDDVAGID